MIGEFHKFRAGQLWNTIDERFRAEKIRGQLRGNSAEPFGVKPRGMHWRTYRRLCEEAEQAEAAAESWFSESIGLSWRQQRHEHVIPSRLRVHA
jgi:hypothetical protein